MRKIFYIFCLYTLLYSNNLYSQEETQEDDNFCKDNTCRIAILNFQDLHFKEKDYLNDKKILLKNLLEQSLQLELNAAKSDKYKIITQENILLLTEQPLEDCIASDICDVQIGRNIGAHFIITGFIINEYENNQYKLNLRLTNTKSSYLLNAIFEPFEKQIDIEKKIISGQIIRKLMEPIFENKKYEINHFDKSYNFLGNEDKNSCINSKICIGLVSFSTIVFSVGLIYSFKQL